MKEQFVDYEKLYEEQKKRRFQEISEIFKTVFEVEPEEFYFSEGYLRAIKEFGEMRTGFPFVRLTVSEVKKCKFKEWKLIPCYDDETLIYVFEKYEVVDDKVYKIEVEVYT